MLWVELRSKDQISNVHSHVWDYVLTIYVAVPQQITVMNIVQRYWKNWYSQMQLIILLLS